MGRKEAGEAEARGKGFAKICVNLFYIDMQKRREARGGKPPPLIFPKTFSDGNGKSPRFGVLSGVPVLLVRLGEHLGGLAKLHDVDNLFADHDRARDGCDDLRPREVFDHANGGDGEGQDEVQEWGGEDGQGGEEGLVVVGEDVERDEEELVCGAEDEQRVLSKSKGGSVRSEGRRVKKEGVRELALLL
jgi:hypothetical protein